MLLQLILVIVAAALLPVARAAPVAPNFVLIVMDDMTHADMPFMQNTLSLIGDQGTRYERAFVGMALCSPSRATMLTGRYAHNTQIYNNDPATGGYWRYRDLGLARHSFPYWLRSLGYETGLVGKFMNGYGDPADPLVIPEGWSYWSARLDHPHPHRNFNYALNENGRIVNYDGAATSYATDVYLRKAKEFLKSSVARRRPFLLAFMPHAPHQPMDPAPRHASLYLGTSTPRTPSFRESDMTDKPSFFRSRLVPESKIPDIDWGYRNRLRTMRAADEAIRSLVDMLRVLGQLDRTYLIFTSDNGFHIGEHHRIYNKELAYEEDIRVPLLIRGPGVPVGAVDTGRPVLNIDLAPTIAELAGYTAPVTVDGRSLLPLWKSGNATTLAWRQSFPLARWAWQDPARDPYWNFWYKGIRTRRYTWVEWSNGERELYDNEVDRFQLQNQAGIEATAFLRTRLSELSAALATCVGQGCRDLENEALFPVVP